MLLVLALAAGVVLTGVSSRIGHRGRVGAAGVVAALAVASVGDRILVHAVPRDPVGPVGPWMAASVVAVLVGWGARRLPPVSVAGLPPVLPLALGSLVGVWAGVPETSAALLAGGVLGGVAVVAVALPVALSSRGAVVVSVVPVAAACVGAAGNTHALLGGLLCSTTFAALSAGPRIKEMPTLALIRGSVVHLTAAVVAARQIGVERDWHLAPVWVALVAGLALLAARMLRSDQRIGSE